MKKCYLLSIIISFCFALTTQAQTPYEGIPYEFVPATLDELSEKPWAKMAYGTYNNPGRTIGADSSGKTHQIITISSRDNNTCDNNGSAIALSTLPAAGLIPDWDVEKDGPLRAMRLNDDRPNNPSNALGSQITYYFKPDSNRNILMVYFAFVTEYPGHSYEHNPKFSIEVLQANDTLIPTANPKHAYFLVNPQGSSANENPVSHDSILKLNNRYYTCGNGQWSNWFPVAFDLRDYIGQEIRLRISATDCHPAGHYAYAYFTARGLSGSINVEALAGDSVRFSVPSGFQHYEWRINDQVMSDSTYELIKERNINDVSISCVLTSFNGATMTFSTKINYYDLNPDFTWAVDSATNYYDVQFTNQSILNIVNGGDTVSQEIKYIEWNFGDGTPISTEINPIHRYANPGTYTVSLTLYDNEGKCDTTVNKTIVIDTITYELSPNFEWNKTDSGVQFINQSILNIIRGGDTVSQEIKYVEWNFGDETPVSTEINPIHQYADKGTYTVSLTLYDNEGKCDSTITKEIVIDSLNAVHDYLNDKNIVTLFPNPATNLITVSSDTEIELIEILNTNGQLLISRPCVGIKEESIDVSSYATGFYLMRIKNNAGTAIRKIMIQ